MFHVYHTKKTMCDVFNAKKKCLPRYNKWNEKKIVFWKPNNRILTKLSSNQIVKVGQNMWIKFIFILRLKNCFFKKLKIKNNYLLSGNRGTAIHFSLKDYFLSQLNLFIQLIVCLEVLQSLNEFNSQKYL